MCCGNAAAQAPASLGPADPPEVWWLFVRWYGTPAPLRWWAWIRWGVPLSAWGDSCGCIARLRDLTDRIALALWGPTLPVAVYVQ